MFLRQIRQFSTATQHADVAIIGAGLSGLAAARRLQQEGLKGKPWAQHKKIVVVESKHRVGGRVWTDEYLGFPFDLGAQWLYADEIQKTPLRQILTDSGVHYKNWSVKDSDILKMHSKDGVELLRDDSRVANARTNLKVLQGANLIFPRGMWSVFEGLSDANIDVRKGEMVFKVEYTDMENRLPARIYTQKNTFQAKQVVCTAPLGVLKSGKIKFTPPLPTLHLSSIRRLRNVLLDKVILLFPNDVQLLPKGKTVLLVSGPRGSMEFFSISLWNPNVNGLVGFLTGDLAREVESWEDEDIVEEALDILRSVKPDLPQHTGFRVTRWASDPNARGSFSRLGREDSPVLFDQLAQPVKIPVEEGYESPGNWLFFAGEHTSSTYPATVQGAWESGVRAAEQVLQEWQKELI